MRAAEFLRKLADAIAVIEDDPEKTAEPVKLGEPSSDGTPKFSPPLQQHVDAVKASVGATPDVPASDPELNKTALISKIPSVLG